MTDTADTPEVDETEPDTGEPDKTVDAASVGPDQPTLSEMAHAIASTLVVVLLIAGMVWAFVTVFVPTTVHERASTTTERVTITEPVIVDTQEVLGEFNGVTSYEECAASSGDILSYVNDYGRSGTHWAGPDSPDFEGVRGCDHGEPLRYKGKVQKLLESATGTSADPSGEG